MEKEIKKLEGCDNEIEIKLSNEELEPYFMNAYKQAQPEINMPGFRKGRVPIKTIKQLFGKQIEADAQQDVISQIFTTIAQEEKLHIIGDPRLLYIERTDEGLKAKILYETLPDFELVDYRGMALDEPVHVVSDDEIDEEIDKLCKHNGTFEDKKEIENEEYVAGIKLRELDKEAMVPILDKEAKETHVYLADETVLPDLKANLIHSTVGDKFRFNPHESDPQAPDTLFEVELIEAQKLIPREFNNEFVEEYSKGKYSTTEELRDEMNFSMQQQWDERSREFMENQIVDQLVVQHDFPVPETVVTKVMEAMFEDIKKRYEKSPEAKNLSFEAMKNDLKPIATRNVKWEIIKNKIIDTENIQVEDFDVDPIVDPEAERLKTDAAMLKKNLMENNDFVGRILSKKVMDFIMDFAVMNEISFEDLEHDHDHGHDHAQDHGQSPIISTEPYHPKD